MWFVGSATVAVKCNSERGKSGCFTAGFQKRLGPRMVLIWIINSNESQRRSPKTALAKFRETDDAAWIILTHGKAKTSIFS